MVEYALRLANGQDTAARMRRGDALGLLPAGPLAVRAGLRPDGGGEVNVVDGTMVVDVAPFMGWVEGGATTAQGGYPFVSDETKTVAFTAGDPTLDRVDTVVARVRDDAYDGSGFTDAEVVVIEGTPGGGAPALPTSCVPLRDVNIPAGVSAGTGGLSGSNAAADRRVYVTALGGVVPVKSATERDALTAHEGQVVWNAGLGTLEVFDGSSWVPMERESTAGAVVSAYRDAAKSITSGGYQNVAVTAFERNDVGATINASGELVLPPGSWDISARTSFPTQDSGTRICRLIIGGAARDRDSQPGNPSGTTVLHPQKVWSSASDITVGLSVYQSSGQTLNLMETLDERPMIEAIRLGDA